MSERQVLLERAAWGNKKGGEAVRLNAPPLLDNVDGVILETSGVRVWSLGIESPATGNALEKGIGPSSRAKQSPPALRLPEPRAGIGRSET